jgi:hypothetical protein
MFLKQLKMSWKVIVIILIVIVLVVVSIVIWKKVQKKIELKNAEKAFEESQVSGTTTGGTTYTFNGATVATQVHEALHGYLWEYEEDAITAINNVPREFMKSVRDAYRRMYNLDMLADIQKYFDEGNFERVRAQLM